MVMLRDSPGGFMVNTIQTEGISQEITGGRQPVYGSRSIILKATDPRPSIREGIALFYEAITQHVSLYDQMNTGSRAL